MLTRSSGRGGLLQPDVLVVGDPFRPMTAIESILRLDRDSDTRMNTRTALTIFMALACVLFLRPAAAAEGDIDRFIEQRMDEAGMVGLGAAIIVDKKVVWMKGYGFADKERAVPFTPDTVMNIGSISKTFTGVALMHAVQEGKLSLDEDINAYLPFKVVNPHSSRTAESH